MYECPICATRLVRAKRDKGNYWVCQNCGGRLVSIGLLRRIADLDNVQWLWTRGRDCRTPGKKLCPLCQRFMVEIPLRDKRRSPMVDVCRYCAHVWFSPLEYEMLRGMPHRGLYRPRHKFQHYLKKRKRRESPLLPNSKIEGDPEQVAKEAIALSKVKALAEDKKYPDEPWKMLLAVFGVPVEVSRKKLSIFPWITWTLAALITIVGMIGLMKPGSALDSWGLVPDHMLRKSGVTLVTHFFVHAGVFHLLGNLYFLMTFGNNVEEFLGKGRYLLLILFGTLGSSALHILFTADTSGAVVGASGALSAIIAFYVLTFPTVRFGMYFWILIFPKWINISSLSFFIMWVSYQLVGVYFQFSGFSKVSAIAHLGGMAVGAAFWYKYREEPATRFAT